MVSVFNWKRNNDAFEKKARAYLHKNKRSRRIWLLVIVALAAILSLQGLLGGGYDQILQEKNELPKEPVLQNIPNIMNGLNFAEENDVIKTICVYDEYSKKGIGNVKIFLDDRGVGRTAQFGCSDISVPKDDKDHTLMIKGRSLIEPFDSKRFVNAKSENTLEFYVNLYDDSDLYVIAYNMVNESREERKLPTFKQGNDLNAQKWAEYLQQNMMTDTGMMENARAQLVQTHGYIKKLRDVVCMKENMDCPPTFYAYSCETVDCTIERGEAVTRIIDAIANNRFVKSTEFKYITIGISYDEHVMFMVFNFA